MTSWWQNVPREAWGQTVAAQQPRQQQAKPIRVTASDAPSRPRRYDERAEWLKGRREDR